MKLLWTALLFCSLSFAFGQETPSFETVKGHFETRMAGIVSEYTGIKKVAGEKYLALLDSVEQTVTKTGDLDLVLLVKKEERRFQESASAPTELAPESFSLLRRLQTAFAVKLDDVDKDYAKKVVLLINAYENALEKLVVRLTQESRLDEAIQAKETLDSLMEHEELVKAEAIFNRLRKAQEATLAAAEAAPTAPATAQILDPTSEEELKAALKRANPNYLENGLFQRGKDEWKHIMLKRSGISDLSPLKGLAIDSLDLSMNPLSSLEAVKDIQLNELRLDHCRQLTDLTPLASSQIRKLSIRNTRFIDFSPLKELPLESLSLAFFEDTRLENFDQLAGLPIRTFMVDRVPLKSINFLKGAPLSKLMLRHTDVKDISVLKGMHLESLDLSDTPVDENSLPVIKSLDNLRLLVLTGTRLSEKEIDYLRKELPRTKVVVKKRK